jgi:hypothetical protein
MLKDRPNIPLPGGHILQLCRLKIEALLDFSGNLLAGEHFDPSSG